MIEYEYMLRYELRGSHYHCALFSRKKGTSTYAKCGDLVFNEEEWPSAFQKLTMVEFKRVEEEEPAHEHLKD